MPFSLATFFPRSSDMRRLSSISHLFPKKFYYLTRRSRRIWPISIRSTSSDACSLIFLSHLEMLSKLFGLVISYTSRMPLAPLLKHYITTLHYTYLYKYIRLFFTLNGKFSGWEIDSSYNITRKSWRIIEHISSENTVAHYLPVIACGDGVEPFLASSVPYLQFNLFALQFHRFDFKINSNCRNESGVEGIIGKSEFFFTVCYLLNVLQT